MKPTTISTPDSLFIKGLKAGDSHICHQFFYSEIIGILKRIRYELLRNQVDLDEMVNELYIYLSRDGWAKLDSFGARNDCRLRSWMIPVAWRYFLACRERLLSIDSVDSADCPEHPDESSHDDLRIQIAIDVQAVLERMPNRRYADVLHLLVIEGYPAADVADMLGVRVENIYNIKHRAISQFVEIYRS